MISRKTALVIAEAFSSRFSSPGYRSSGPTVHSDWLFDFLYQCDHEAWFCNAAKQLRAQRSLKEWLMRLHTGETQLVATLGWTVEQRAALGQRYLRDLAEDFLQWYSGLTDNFSVGHYRESVETLRRALELDGYLFRSDVLLCPEADVLNVADEVGLLERLHSDLKLGNQKLAFECLRLSEEHYREGRWSDCIANSRKFLESVLQEIASRYSLLRGQGVLPESTFSRPVEIREYLQKNGVVEKREREAIDKIYGLLSHTGSHPYMADADQARLLRQLSLIVSQFALLRLEGAVK